MSCPHTFAINLIFFSASICLEIFILTLVRAQMQMHAHTGMQTHDVRPTMQARSLRTRSHTHIHMKTKHTLAWSMSQKLGGTYTQTRSLFFQLVLETTANKQGYPTSPVAKRAGLITRLKLSACGRACLCVLTQRAGDVFCCLLCAIEGENHLS